MKRALAILLAAQSASAQIHEIPPSNPALAPDAANDFFARSKNVYDAAQATTDAENKRGLYDRSGALFTEYLASFPNHPNAEMAWWYLGNSHYQAGRAAEAKRAFNILITRFPNGKWAAAAAYTLAADSYNRGEFTAAAPLFERYAAGTDKPSERARGNYLAGICYQSTGRDAQSVAAFQRVVSDPQPSTFKDQAIVALGHASMKEGKLQDAFSRFKQVADSSAAVAKVRGEAALNASLTAGKLGDATGAARYLDIIMQTPGMEEFKPEAQTALMANAFTAKNYEEVVRLFQAGRSLGKGEAEASRLMLAARSYMRLKQPAQALTLFRDVEKLVRPDSETAFQAAYYRLLCFHQIEGRHLPEQVDAFLQLYRKSRSGDSRIHTALLMKAESLFAEGEEEKAAKVFSEINPAALSPKNRPGLFFQRGWCFAEAGDTQGAVTSFTDFINAYPDDPRVPSAIAKRAAAYAAGAETAKAIADYDRLTKPGTPKELLAYGWLESARLYRSENKIPEMIARYKGLLENAAGIDRKLVAEANYWIGWGLVKQNIPRESIPYLAKARELRPDTFGKHAGILLALGYFSAQEPEKLAAEIDAAIKGSYAREIPDQALQWSALQSFNARNYEAAARAYELIATPDDPRSTAKEIWRYYGKSLIRTGNFAKALTAVNNVLATEDNAGWKANALFDRAEVLHGLQRNEEARKSVDEALDLHPQDRTNTQLRMLSGDIFAAVGDDKKAGAEYQIIVQLHDDAELRPLALYKLAETYAKLGDPAEAAKYRAKLATDYPKWKNPG